MTIEEINSELEKRMEAIAAERDKLDELISNATQLRDNCDRAYEDIWHARDALSELV